MTAVVPTTRKVPPGLYLITDSSLGAGLGAVVEAALAGGVRIVQYRDKSSDSSRRLREATLLRDLCRRHDAELLINDDIELAAALGVGVHLGRGDGSLQAARARLGPRVLIGATCHASLTFAEQAALEGADYLALGAFHPSASKPSAVRADIALLEEARRFGLPLVAIGGITLDNAPPLIQAGAHCVAVINDICARPVDRITAHARAYSQLFRIGTLPS